MVWPKQPAPKKGSSVPHRNFSSGLNSGTQPPSKSATSKAAIKAASKPPSRTGAKPGVKSKPKPKPRPRAEFGENPNSPIIGERRLPKPGSAKRAFRRTRGPGTEPGSNYRDRTTSGHRSESGSDYRDRPAASYRVESNYRAKTTAAHRSESGSDYGNMAGQRSGSGYRDNPRGGQRPESGSSYRDNPRGGQRSESGSGYRDNPRGGQRPGSGYRDNPRGGQRSESGSNYRDNPRGGQRPESGSNYRDNPRGGQRPESGSSYRDNPRGGQRSESGSNYRDNPRGGQRSESGSRDKPGLKKNSKSRNTIAPHNRAPMPAPTQDRLQKILANAGLCSRREAERLIAEGRVNVGGSDVTEAGLKVDPYRDSIMVDGILIPPPEKLRYYMFHKPAGYLTTLSDPQGRPTIKGFIDHLPVRVFPVGRLDMDVEGLLILTNDGDLAKSLMHPISKVPKCYRVKVDGLPDEDDMNRLRNGTLMIDHRQAAPAEAEMMKTAADRAWLLLTLTEGRHHQVKRMCTAIGHPVMKLKRISYAGLELGALRREVVRPLSWTEVQQLKESCEQQ